MVLLVAVDLTILITYTTVKGVRGQLDLVVLVENRENPMDVEGVSENNLTYISQSGKYCLSLVMRTDAIAL